MRHHRFVMRAAIAGAAVLLSPMAFAQKRMDAPRIVTWNCSGCHGLDGNSQPTYFPRLAGLNAAYAERRIMEFRAAKEPSVDEIFYRIAELRSQPSGANTVEAGVNMVGIAHAMTAAQIKESAAWYAAQKPKPGRSGNPALVAAGKLLFIKGAADQGLPACQTCHGADAEGKGKTPLLAGQNSGYVLSELAKFNAGDRKHAPEMTVIVKHVNIEQYRALAAYLRSR